MYPCRLGLVIVTLLVIIHTAENKENLDSDICGDLLRYIKKNQKTKKNEETQKVSNEKKSNKLKNLEENIEKYFEKKFPWWPKRQIEELDVPTETTKPTTANPMEAFLASYIDFLNYLFKML